MNKSQFLPIYKKVVFPSLFLFLLVLLFVIAPWYFGSEYVAKKELDLNKAENKYKQLYGQVRFLLEQYSIYEKHGALFYDLEKRGLVTSEKRPVWIDNIPLFGYALNFSNLRASFIPQLPVKGKRLGDQNLDPDLFKINPVNIITKMPIDIDFFRFVAFVNNDISRYSFFDKCEFKSPYVKSKQLMYNKSNNSLFASKGVPATIDINCDLNIITSHPRRR